MISLSPPSSDLAGQIEMFWAVKGDGTDTTAFHEVLPGSNVGLVFRYSPTGCRLVLMGPATEQATVEIDRSSDYFGISFRTAQAPLLGSISHGALVNGHHDLEMFGDRSINELAEMFLELSDMTACQKVMEDVIRQCGYLVADQRCRQAGTLLEKAGGHMQVKDLASVIGVHVRTLERLFRTHLGVTPKRLARLVRLKGVAQRLRQGDVTSLAELALSCGYSDQAHMVRDFKGMTGLLPSSIAPGDVHAVSGKPRTKVVHRYRA